MGNARRFVLKLLLRLEESGSYSNILLDQKLSKSDLSEQDRRFAAALYYGVIERRLTLDAVIDGYRAKKSERLGAEIRNILRLGVYQLKYMDSIPDNAAVDESVKLAKKVRNPAAAGFVNAVLRGFIRDQKRLPAVKGRIKELSLEYSCPEWLVEKWCADYGERECEGILKASLGRAPEYLRLNTVREDERSIVALLESQGIKVKNFRNGCAEITGGGPVEALDAYKQGLIHVQDLSCQLCCIALGARSGETVLDMCAAPGGKSFTIAELMNDEGRVLSFDLHENRVRLIRSGAERLGLKSISADVNNAKAFNENIPQAQRVLCDVPCSGLGVIGKKPEIKYKAPEELERLPQIQREILAVSSAYVKKDGVLVYSTCSLSKAENDDVAEWFLKENPDFEPAPLGEAFAEHSQDSSITIFPQMFGSDGFYIAKFRRLR